MQLNPLWNLWDNKIQYPQLNSEIEVDVCIIGGGITGILTAALLLDKGLSIAVIEAKSIGKGTSGQSTGNLYTITEDLFSTILSKYDKDILHQIINVRRQGINLIKNCIDSFKIDCDYHPSSMYIFSIDNKDFITEELKSARSAGIDIKTLDDKFPYAMEDGFEIDGQAQFNPLIFVQELAKNINNQSVEIFENSQVLEIDDDDGKYLVKTSLGTIISKYVVEATHTPKGLKTEFHTTLAPYREYGIAARLKSEKYPSNGIFWKYYDDKKFSFRTYERSGEKFLLGIGQSHKVGQAESSNKLLNNLIEYAESMFPIQRIQYCWGGQNYKPASYLPYIGKMKEGENQYVASGFSADGLVYGAAAAQFISDSILGIDNPYSDLFLASKKRIIKAAGRFVKENTNVAAQLIKDLSVGNKELEEININTGKVIRMDGSKVAVYRKSEDTYYKISAICPHMGCTVRWNDAEHTWDCPCHGSRFNIDGNVIEGPAFNGLEPINDNN